MHVRNPRKPVSEDPVHWKQSRGLEGGPTFPPPGWCFMLSVEPILERALRMSGAGAALGRAVVLEGAADEEAGRGVRGTVGFFSGAAPVVEEGVAGLAAVVLVREAAVVAVEAVLRRVGALVALGLEGSAESESERQIH